MEETIGYGEQIREMRKAKRLTQAEFAHKAGIAVNSLRRYESNEREPTMEIIAKMAHALDMDIKSFLWSDPASGNYYFWEDELREKLEQVGGSVGYEEEGAVFTLILSDGTLEVAESELIDLNESTKSFLKFKIEELKQKHLKDFVKNKESRRK